MLPVPVRSGSLCPHWAVVCVLFLHVCVRMRVSVSSGRGVFGRGRSCIACMCPLFVLLCLSCSFLSFPRVCVCVCACGLLSVVVTSLGCRYCGDGARVCTRSFARACISDSHTGGCFFFAFGLCHSVSYSTHSIHGIVGAEGSFQGCTMGAHSPESIILQWCLLSNHHLHLWRASECKGDLAVPSPSPRPFCSAAIVPQ